MEIRKGEEFLCIKDVVMISKTVAYKKGKIYISQYESCITDEQGNIEHYWQNEDDFKSFFKLVQDKPNVFVYYRGDKERGNEIINELEKLGGKNECEHDGSLDERYYYVDRGGTISIGILTDWMKDHYTEVFLPEVKEEIKTDIDPFEKVLYKNTSYTVDRIWIPTLRIGLCNDSGRVYDWVSKIIPYNDETKYLAYTTLDAPDKYK